jgi:signal transduction histidine kinase/ActR/RegA family two-component response regulator
MQNVLDDGLDELAVSTHAGSTLRIVVTAGIAFVFAQMLPWLFCLGWAVACVAIELIAWFATRRQYLGQAVGWRTRLWHVSSLAVASVAWVTMGAMLWLSGSLEGALCGILVWLSVVFFAQTNAYQSKIGFVVGGAIPGALVLAIVLLGPNPLHLRLLPVGLVLVVAFCFAAEGVTRRLAARRHLNETQLKVRQSAALWRMLFDQSPLPQISFNAAGVYNLLRPYAEAGVSRLGETLRTKISRVEDVVAVLSLMGANKAAEELYGVSDFEGSVAASHFDASFLAGFCDSLDGLRPDGSFPPFDARVLRADGTAVDVCVHIRTVPEGENPWSKCIATFVDMTEVQRAARAQQEALEAAETANRAKGEFLATMSHEIRTPLNGVLGMVQAMQRDALEGPQRERLAVIGQSGETLLTILNDILDLSKIEAGGLELEELDFDLEPLALGVRETFRPLADNRGLGFTVEIEPQAQGVYRGDPVRIRQILFNLISNALKFTSDGSVAVQIGLAEGGLSVRVTDTGIGMEPDQIERLFDKFVQADTSTTRRFGGTGLGLSICRELCLAMGGDITAESEIGRGSCFKVVLPLTRVADATVVATADTAAEPTFDDRPLRILAAEDNPVNQLVLKTLLAQAGLESLSVGNGEEALAAWSQGEWDVILMDVQMPVMDGIAATREIRRLEAATGRPATPIIALTANAMSHQVEGYAAAGMNGFVAKPIEVGKLFAAIGAAVNGEPENTSVAAGMRSV